MLETRYESYSNFQKWSVDQGFSYVRRKGKNFSTQYASNKIEKKEGTLEWSKASTRFNHC